jgi:hypothetical protein
MLEGQPVLCDLVYLSSSPSPFLGSPCCWTFVHTDVELIRFRVGRLVVMMYHVLNVFISRVVCAGKLPTIELIDALHATE